MWWKSCFRPPNPPGSAAAPGTPGLGWCRSKTGLQPGPWLVGGPEWFISIPEAFHAAGRAPTMILARGSHCPKFSPAKCTAQCHTDTDMAVFNKGTATPIGNLAEASVCLGHMWLCYSAWVCAILPLLFGSRLTAGDSAESVSRPCVAHRLSLRTF